MSAHKQALAHSKNKENHVPTNLVKLLSKLNTFAVITSLTTVKTAAKHKGTLVQKINTSSVQLFSNTKSSVYENAMKRKVDADFKVGERTWGERHEGTAFIAHKDMMYLECIFNKSIENQYMVDGVIVDKADIEQYLTPAAVKALHTPKTDPVVIRSYKCSSIKAISVNKQLYTNLHV